MRTARIMGKMHHTARSVHANPIPQFRDLRRIPTRFRHILPLKVMKRYRCAVIGSAQGVLTIAITDRQNTSLIDTLTRLTGHAIFPVWIRATRMHLLFQRIERWERRKDEMLRWPHPLNLVEIHILVAVPIY